MKIYYFIVTPELTTLKTSRIPQQEDENLVSTKSPFDPSSTKLPKNLNSTEFDYDEYLCTCDLTKNSCDVNCCCDEECSQEDRKAFIGNHLITS